MRLSLLFIVMDLLTLLAYPIVYVHGRLRPFSKPKENAKLATSLLIGTIMQVTNQKIMNEFKKGFYAY